MYVKTKNNVNTKNRKPPAVGEGRRERRVRTRGVTRSIPAREDRQTEAIFRGADSPHKINYPGAQVLSL
jgi:hypothetical protein